MKFKHCLFLTTGLLAFFLEASATERVEAGLSPIDFSTQFTKNLTKTGNTLAPSGLSETQKKVWDAFFDPKTKLGLQKEYNRLKCKFSTFKGLQFNQDNVEDLESLLTSWEYFQEQEECFKKLDFSLKDYDFIFGLDVVSEDLLKCIIPNSQQRKQVSNFQKASKDLFQKINQNINSLLKEDFLKKVRDGLQVSLKENPSQNLDFFQRRVWNNLFNPEIIKKNAENFQEGSNQKNNLPGWHILYSLLVVERAKLDLKFRNLSLVLKEDLVPKELVPCFLENILETDEERKSLTEFYELSQKLRNFKIDLNPLSRVFKGIQQANLPLYEGAVYITVFWEILRNLRKEIGLQNLSQERDLYWKERDLTGNSLRIDIGGQDVSQYREFISCVEEAAMFAQDFVRKLATDKGIVDNFRGNQVQSFFTDLSFFNGLKTVQDVVDKMTKLAPKGCEKSPFYSLYTLHLAKMFFMELKAQKRVEFYSNNLKLDRTYGIDFENLNKLGEILLKLKAPLEEIQHDFLKEIFRQLYSSWEILERIRGGNFDSRLITDLLKKISLAQNISEREAFRYQTFKGYQGEIPLPDFLEALPYMELSGKKYFPELEDLGVTSETQKSLGVTYFTYHAVSQERIEKFRWLLKRVEQDPSVLDVFFPHYRSLNYSLQSNRKKADQYSSKIEKIRQELSNELKEKNQDWREALLVLQDQYSNQLFHDPLKTVSESQGNLCGLWSLLNQNENMVRVLDRITESQLLFGDDLAKIKTLRGDCLKRVVKGCIPEDSAGNKAWMGDLQKIVLKYLNAFLKTIPTGKENEESGQLRLNIENLVDNLNGQALSVSDLQTLSKLFGLNSIVLSTGWNDYVWHWTWEDSLVNFGRTIVDEKGNVHKEESDAPLSVVLFSKIPDPEKHVQNMFSHSGNWIGKVGHFSKLVPKNVQKETKPFREDLIKQFSLND